MTHNDEWELRCLVAEAELAEMKESRNQLKENMLTVNQELGRLSHDEAQETNAAEVVAARLHALQLRRTEELEAKHQAELQVCISIDFCKMIPFSGF